jgi:hypothetical protein
MFGDQLGIFDAPPVAAFATTNEAAKPAMPPADPGPIVPNKMRGKSDRSIGFAVAAQQSARALYEAYTARYSALDGRPW